MLYFLLGVLVGTVAGVVLCGLLKMARDWNEHRGVNEGG